jgi:ferredoxin
MAPEIFELTEDGLEVLRDQLSDAEEDLARDAIDCCPVEALSLSAS